MHGMQQTNLTVSTCCFLVMPALFFGECYRVTQVQLSTSIGLTFSAVTTYMMLMYSFFIIQVVFLKGRYFKSLWYIVEYTIPVIESQGHLKFNTWCEVFNQHHYVLKTKFSLFLKNNLTDGGSNIPWPLAKFYFFLRLNTYFLNSSFYLLFPF